MAEKKTYLVFPVDAIAGGFGGFSPFTFEVAESPEQAVEARGGPVSDRYFAIPIYDFPQYEREVTTTTKVRRAS